MTAKLIRVEKNAKGISYLDTYYFECADCGKEYFRHANNKRINPYCGACQRKHDNEKQKERLKAKKNQGIIVELEEIKAEIGSRTCHCFDNEALISVREVLQYLDERISELKRRVQ